ncbi:MAG: hypothetical protein ACKO6I_03100 [Sphingomonadales bacterium]
MCLPPGPSLYSCNHVNGRLKSLYLFEQILWCTFLFQNSSNTTEQASIAIDPWGNTKAGFNLEGSISRKDWGLTWNAPLEAGGFLVSDEEKILCEVPLMKQT